MNAVVIAGLVYLAALFVLAEAVERRWISPALADHPWTHALSLGVYATSWSFFGSVGFARRDGLSFLTIYVGVTLSCLAAPFLWRPIARVMHARQLGSLADLLAYRYQSQLVGVATTVFVVVGALPYLALQIRAIVRAVEHVGGAQGPLLAPGFGLVLAAFATLFGARHASVRERHPGLVVALAAESALKLVAMLVAVGWALFGPLEGPRGLAAHLAAHPELVEALFAPARGAPWTALVVVTFAAAFLLPRQFHLAFVEAPDGRALETTRWLLPAYLWLLTLGVPVLLWAGLRVAPGGDPDLYVLELVRDQPALTVLVFLGGLSASSAMVIVTALALGAMIVNHLVLPLARPRSGDLRADIARLRRAIVVAVVAAGVAVLYVLPAPGALVDLGLASFVAVAQFLPAVLGVVAWRGASAAGVLSGLALGAAAWAAGLAGGREDVWSWTTSLSLTLNVAGLLIGSWLWPPSRAADEAALRCAAEGPTPAPPDLDADALVARLAPVLGARAATLEVERAVQAVPGEGAAVRRRRVERLEANLSAVVGPVLARLAVGDVVPPGDAGVEVLVDQLRFAERAAHDLRGPAAQVDAVRRWLREVLDALPLGVAVVAPDGEIVLWNPAMAAISGVAADAAIATPLASIDGPVGAALTALPPGAGAASFDAERSGARAGQRALVVWRSPLGDDAGADRGVVIVVDDRTQQRALEAQLAHHDRLASIGRLAAGVAHEIGNPLTGILMLARRLGRDAPTADVRADADEVGAQAERIHAIVRALVGFSRREGDVRGEADLARVVDEAARLTRLTRAGREVTIAVDVPSPCPARGDPARLTQIVVNLLSNAVDASPQGGRVEVRADATAEGLVLDVVDHGDGVPATLRERIFEPFFTTKPALSAAALSGSGPGMKWNLTGRVGLELKLLEGFSFLAEGFWHRSFFALAAVDQGRVKGVAQALGVETGFLYTF